MTVSLPFTCVCLKTLYWCLHGTWWMCTIIPLFFPQQCRRKVTAEVSWAQAVTKETDLWISYQTSSYLGGTWVTSFQSMWNKRKSIDRNLHASHRNVLHCFHIYFWKKKSPKNVFICILHKENRVVPGFITDLICSGDADVMAESFQVNWLMPSVRTCHNH